MNKEIGKMKGEGSLKTKAQTTEKQRETQGSCKKKPPISTRCVATTHVALPLRIKCGAKSQGSLIDTKKKKKKNPLIFYVRHDTSQ